MVLAIEVIQPARKTMYLEYYHIVLSSGLQDVELQFTKYLASKVTVKGRI